MSEELKPCPFCGGDVSAVVLDDEGNIRDEEYERDPYSGLSYAVTHDDPTGACPIVTYDEPILWLYDSRNGVAHVWNRRAERTCHWMWIEDWSDDELGRECNYANWALDCGCWDGWDRELHDFDDPCESPREWDYCPRCGARIVKEE